jgi:endonuclease YncB( thermonuclease family)
MTHTYAKNGYELHPSILDPAWCEALVSTLGRAVCLLMLLALPAQAQTVVDGDTLKLNGKTFRLHGIDAPELSQTCEGWLAGEYAAAVLRGMLEKRFVVCIPKTTDRYGRTVAVCLADGMDVGAEMVRQGMALAFTRYSHDYVPYEAAARSDGLGIHGANCKPAWEYRSEKR